MAGDTYNTLTRSRLFDLIWKIPRSRLAQQFGLSDVGLAKLCRRLDVPQPSRGYWAKLAVGKAPPRALLPNPSDEVLVDLRALTEEEVSRRDLREREARERETRLKALPNVTLPATLSRPHTLVKATLAFYDAIPGQLKRDARRSRLTYYEPREAPWADNGRFTCLDGDAIPIKVSLDQAKRACRLLDVLLKRLEETGFHASIRKPDRGGSPRDTRLILKRNGEACAIEMSEGYSRVSLSAEERAALDKSSASSRSNTQPNGRIALTVSGVEFGGSHSWRDTTTSTIEDRLAEIIATVMELNPQQAVLREERRQAEEERARKEAERYKQQELADLRDKEFREVLAEARIASDLESIGRYLDALEARLSPSAEFQSLWLRTMRLFARLLDPLEDRLDSLERHAKTNADIKLLASLRQVDNEQPFLTALLEKSPFTPSPQGWHSWEKYTLVGESVSIKEDEGEEYDGDD